MCVSYLLIQRSLLYCNHLFCTYTSLSSHFLMSFTVGGCRAQLTPTASHDISKFGLFLSCGAAVSAVLLTGSGNVLYSCCCGKFSKDRTVTLYNVFISLPLIQQDLWLNFYPVALPEITADWPCYFQIRISVKAQLWGSVWREFLHLTRTVWNVHDVHTHTLHVHTQCGLNRRTWLPCWPLLCLSLVLWALGTFFLQQPEHMTACRVCIISGLLFFFFKFS